MITEILESPSPLGWLPRVIEQNAIAVHFCWIHWLMLMGAMLTLFYAAIRLYQEYTAGSVAAESEGGDFQ